MLAEKLEQGVFENWTSAELSNPVEAALYADALEHDRITRQRAAKFMGGIILSQEASVEYEIAEAASLRNVVEDYFSDDKEMKQNAAKRLRTDFRTNVFEILCANGHVSEVDADYDDGSFYQYGYSLRAMYAHGALHASQPLERKRRDAESVNEFRIEDGYRAGLFRTHYFVEISQAPDDMGTELAGENGYDTETWKGKLRCTDVGVNGKRHTAEAAVAGFDPITERRHDTQGVEAVLDGLGLEPQDVMATTALQRAIWVRKERLPNGAASLAELYDQGLGYPAFFGVRAAQGDYQTIAAQSAAREQLADTEMDARVEKLAQNLRGISSCDEALKTMAIQAKDYAAEICGKDTAYNPAQFGDIAAAHIEAARYYAAAGNQQAFQTALDSAKQTAVVYMCGMRLEMERNAAGELVSTDAEKTEKDCDYISKECPLCKKQDARTHETKSRIECRECKGYVKKTV